MVFECPVSLCRFYICVCGCMELCVLCVWVHGTVYVIFFFFLYLSLTLPIYLRVTPACLYVCVREREIYSETERER